MCRQEQRLESEAAKKKEEEDEHKKREADLFLKSDLYLATANSAWFYAPS
jgi:hypothetical protein